MANLGTLHQYSSKLVAFEHARPDATSTPTPLHTLLWIGGLGDGLLTVPYPRSIAATLPRNWAVAEVLISSSYKGWGTGNLQRDVRELAACVGYFKDLRKDGKVVLMGHSTGCQDAMEYLVGSGSDKRPGLDGVILQGGVSDREAWVDMVTSSGALGAYEAVKAQAKGLVEEGKEKELMPRKGNVVCEEMNTAMSAYRTHSLLSEGGDDDYFSSDLSDSRLEESFGRIPKSTPVMFLLGSEDPYVPKSVDKVALLEKWSGVIRQGGGVVDDKNGGLVEGAHHSLAGDPEEVVADLVRRVKNFLADVGGQPAEGDVARL